MSIISAITGGFTWFWNGLSKIFDVFRFFLREGHRLKGLLITSFLALLKLSYDAAISGLNDVVAELDKFSKNPDIQNSVSDFLEFANAMFPLSEFLAMSVALIHLAALCLVVRAIRSIRVRVF